MNQEDLIVNVAETFTFKQYQDLTVKTAVYPEAGTGSLSAVSYCALGLAGEAGEIANKVKKLLRDCDTEEKRMKIVAECGDVCWYLSQLLLELAQAPLGEVALANIFKLADRQNRGQLHGGGDNR